MYLIEILHQTTTKTFATRLSNRCILSKFYIKPQLLLTPVKFRGRCILSKFYIKPQPSPLFGWRVSCCILSKFYIKPQRFRRCENCFSVVSYRNSTSNHNRALRGSQNATVVSYRNSTSNHNTADPTACVRVLYLIEILHQTTTPGPATRHGSRCILLKFYIKPQPHYGQLCRGFRCILSKFYIKPQRHS